MMARQRNQEKLSSFLPWKHEMWVWENQLTEIFRDKIAGQIKYTKSLPRVTSHSQLRQETLYGYRQTWGNSAWQLHGPQGEMPHSGAGAWSSTALLQPMRFQRQATESVNCISIQSSFPSGMQKNTSIPKCLGSFQKLPSMQRSKK